MTTDSPGDVTSLLHQVRDGTPGAADRLMNRVYTELRHLAQSRVGARDSLEPTALVHEAYLKLFSKSEPSWENRHHFFWAAARAMRDILVDDARRARAAKRGDTRFRIDLDDTPDPGRRAEAVDLLALDDAIAKLEKAHPKPYQVVLLRFFAGLSREETAVELKLSEAAVWRDWNFAKAWLLTEMSGRSPTHAKSNSF